MNTKITNRCLLANFIKWLLAESGWKDYFSAQDVENYCAIELRLPGVPSKIRFLDTVIKTLF